MLARLLKMAEILAAAGDTEGLKALDSRLAGYIKRQAHYISDDDNKTPNIWRKNMDYSPWDNSPYYGSVSEFMKKFPGGIREWSEWRRKNQKDRYKSWDINKRKAFVLHLMEKKGELDYDDLSGDYEPTKEELEYAEVPVSGEERSKAFDLLLKNIEMIKEMADLSDEEIKAWLEKNLGKGGLAAEDDEEVETYVGPIEKDTLENDNYRKVVFTGKKSQLVLMSLKPEEEIGEETHSGIDQFFRVEQGEALVTIDDEEFKVAADEAIIVPAGSKHNVSNSSDKVLKLYTIYSPPEHPKDTVQKTKEDDKGHEKHAHYIPEGGDDVDKFKKEPHLYSGEMDKYKSVEDYLNKYHGGQDAKDAAFDAAKDFIRYWRQILKKKSDIKKGRTRIAGRLALIESDLVVE